MLKEFYWSFDITDLVLGLGEHFSRRKLFGERYSDPK